METSSEHKRVWSWVSPDGKSAAAGMSLGPVGTKPGGGGEEQPYDGHGRYLGTAASGGISGGSEVRGKVTPPQKPKYPPPPPAPRQPHVTYSQKSGELHASEGNLLDKGHSGYGDYRDKPEFEGEKNRGVIPRGNYKVAEMVEDAQGTRRAGMGQHILRLEPADAETRQRLKEMNRDGFWIHKGTLPTASQGCILLPESTRKRIPVGSILRVTL